MADTRRCAACGAQNPASAEWCTLCLTRFDPDPEGSRDAPAAAATPTPPGFRKIGEGSVTPPPWRVPTEEGTAPPQQPVARSNLLPPQQPEAPVPAAPEEVEEAPESVAPEDREIEQPAAREESFVAERPVAPLGRTAETSQAAGSETREASREIVDPPPPPRISPAPQVPGPAPSLLQGAVTPMVPAPPAPARPAAAPLAPAPARPAAAPLAPAKPETQAEQAASRPDLPAPEPPPATPPPPAPAPPTFPPPPEVDTPVRVVTAGGKDRWICPTCETLNDIDADTCRICGTVMARMFSEPEERPQKPKRERTVATAMGLSVVLPGLGHAYVGAAPAGASRGLLYLWTILISWLLLFRPPEGAPGVVRAIGVVFAISAVGVWTLALLESGRYAEGERTPMLSGRWMTLLSAGLTFALLVGLIAAAVGRR